MQVGALQPPQFINSLSLPSDPFSLIIRASQSNLFIWRRRYTRTTFMFRYHRRRQLYRTTRLFRFFDRLFASLLLVSIQSKQLITGANRRRYTSAEIEEPLTATPGHSRLAHETDWRPRLATSPWWILPRTSESPAETNRSKEDDRTASKPREIHLFLREFLSPYHLKDTGFYTA